MINDNQNKGSSLSGNEEIDLIDLFNIAWKDKLKIISITSFFAIFSVIYALSIQDEYKSETLLNISDNSEISSLSRYSGLASMAGINIPKTAGSQKSDLVIERITSRAFLDHILQFEDVLISIMAPGKFDKSSKKLFADPEKYDEENNIWIREPVDGRKAKPSYLETYETYMEILSVSKDKETGFIRLTVQHISPVFAKELLDLIITQINLIFREKDLMEAEEALRFLTSTLPQTAEVSTKNSIARLIQSQLETKMMANIDSEYILKIVEPPFVPELKSAPKRAIICITITFIGGLLATLYVLLRHFYPGSSKESYEEI